MGKGTLCVYTKGSEELGIDKKYDSNTRYEDIFTHQYKLVYEENDEKVIVSEGDLRYQFKDEHHVEIFIGDLSLAVLGYNTTTLNHTLVHDTSSRNLILFLSDCRCYLEDRTEVYKWTRRL